VPLEVCYINPLLPAILIWRLYECACAAVCGVIAESPLSLSPSAHTPHKRVCVWPPSKPPAVNKSTTLLHSTTITRTATAATTTSEGKFEVTNRTMNRNNHDDNDGTVEGKKAGNTKKKLYERAKNRTKESVVLDVQWWCRWCWWCWRWRSQLPSRMLIGF